MERSNKNDTHSGELNDILREYGSAGKNTYNDNQVSQSIGRNVTAILDDDCNDDQEDWEDEYGTQGEHKRRRRPFRKFVITVVVLALCYGFLVYTNNPFIAKWRTIYIETAMTTFSHQWLATKFIPAGVIEEVMLSAGESTALQSGLTSNWAFTIGFNVKNLYLPWSKEEKYFSNNYSEIDSQSFDAFMAEHPDEYLDENGYLVIDEAGLDDDGTTINTIYGDQVLAIDTANGITIIKVTGDGYVGRLAIVKDPSRVGLGLSQNFDSLGATVGNIAQTNNAVLAINGSGFRDPNGQGDGSDAYGLVISGGELLKEAAGGTYKTIGFDFENRLNIGSYSEYTTFRDAVEFEPALIIDGKVLVVDSDGWGIQPRSAIGQTKNGQVLLLIVDGRAPGYSIGCTVGELALIMERYGAYQACNLDGGSSSVLYYNGRELNKPSALNKTNGRYVPDGFVVYNREN